MDEIAQLIRRNIQKTIALDALIVELRARSVGESVSADWQTICRASLNEAYSRRLRHRRHKRGQRVPELRERDRRRFGALNRRIRRRRAERATANAMAMR